MSFHAGLLGQIALSVLVVLCQNVDTDQILIKRCDHILAKGKKEGGSNHQIKN